MKFLFLVLISFSAHAKYFTSHVKQSISINKERRPYYRALTNGKSDAVFSKLIHLEKLILTSAWLYDLRASYFHLRGLPVLKDEFIPMNRAPEFDPAQRKYPEYDIADVPWRNYQTELRKLVKEKKQEELLSRSREIINEFKGQPDYWCLTRHLVESIYRFAWFLPKETEQARLKKIRSPEKLLWEIMDYHLLGFSRFVEVDLLSAPIQKEGIPLLCNELPDLLSDLH
ncbi:MAG: hypothetical protein ACJ76H_00055 [Bacteriovoracaceae bacterium]